MTNSRITLVSDEDARCYSVLAADGTLHHTFDRYHSAVLECRRLGEPNPTIVRKPRLRKRDLARFTL